MIIEDNVDKKIVMELCNKCARVINPAILNCDCKDENEV